MDFKSHYGLAHNLKNKRNEPSTRNLNSSLQMWNESEMDSSVKELNESKTLQSLRTLNETLNLSYNHQDPQTTIDAIRGINSWLNQDTQQREDIRKLLYKKNMDNVKSKVSTK